MSSLFRSLLVTVVLAGGVLAPGARVYAQTSAAASTEDARERARSHFEAGRALYNLKNYSDAIREFSAGYQLSQLPAFLLNLGHAYRKIGDGAGQTDDARAAYTQARVMYKKFLEDSPPNFKQGDEVRQVIAELDVKIASLPPPQPKPATVEGQTAPSPEPAVALVVAPPPHKSFIRRNWWIIPVAAVVVAGVAVGVYFGTRPSGVDCSSASLGCLDAH